MRSQSLRRSIGLAPRGPWLEHHTSEEWEPDAEQPKSAFGKRERCASQAINRQTLGRDRIGMGFDGTGLERDWIGLGRDWIGTGRRDWDWPRLQRMLAQEDHKSFSQTTCVEA